VIDDGARPLSVDGDSPGHFGQMDVSIEGEPVSARTAGREPGRVSQCGRAGAAVRRRARAWVSKIGRTTRRCARWRGRSASPTRSIGHTTWRSPADRQPPAHLLPRLREAIDHQLTGIARAGWTLTTGDSDFHAARGAARPRGRSGSALRAGRPRPRRTRETPTPSRSASPT
jgi:hypothetical protein